VSQYPQLVKDPARSGSANFMVVSGSYFETMDIPVLKGRTFRAVTRPNHSRLA